MIFPSVHYALAEFRGGGRRFGPPLNTPLMRFAHSALMLHLDQQTEIGPKQR